MDANDRAEMERLEYFAEKKAEAAEKRIADLEARVAKLELAMQSPRRDTPSPYDIKARPRPVRG